MGSRLIDRRTGEVRPAQVFVAVMGAPNYTYAEATWSQAMFDEIGYAHGDGRYPKVMRKLARTDVIILDDWGLSKLTAPQRRDLLEILEGPS